MLVYLLPKMCLSEIVGLLDLKLAKLLRQIILYHITVLIVHTRHNLHKLFTGPPVAC